MNIDISETNLSYFNYRNYFICSLCIIFGRSIYVSLACSSSYLKTRWCILEAAWSAWNRWDRSLSYLLQCIIRWTSADNERIRFPSFHIISPSAAYGTKSLSLTFPNSINMSAKATAMNRDLAFTHNQDRELQHSDCSGEWCWCALEQGTMASQWQRKGAEKKAGCCSERKKASVCASGWCDTGASALTRV